MGPGFISPDDYTCGGAVEAIQQASMGPGFISPDDATDGLLGYLDLFKLQWGRASSARMTMISPMRISFGVMGFNGAGLHQPG